MSSKRFLTCPNCGGEVERFINPFPTVDVIMELEGGRIVLIYRKNPPIGWALPGGFVDYGETVEEAAAREAEEETSLRVERLRQFRTYSDPARDPRHHSISTVFVAEARGEPRAADDAEEIGVFEAYDLPENVVFDHKKIIEDYLKQREEGRERER